MNSWALVPLKARAAGKQRLAAVLADEARAALVQQMFTHVLSALRGCSSLAGIAVVTAEPEVLPPQLLWLSDPASGMNGAVLSALSELSTRQVSHCVVVSADLPQLTSADVSALLAVAAERGLALAPDRHGRGTNALALELPTRFRPQFGLDSLARHRRQAAELALTSTLVRRPGLEFDVDEPEDLALLRERGYAASASH